MRILIIEHQYSNSSPLIHLLTKQKYVVDVIDKGEAAIEMIQSIQYDLVILDALLPDWNAVSFCQYLRDRGNWVLILMMNSMGNWEDAIEGLNAGADDYIHQSMPLPELEARIRALLRRQRNPQTSPILTIGELSMNPHAFEVTYSGEPLTLRPKEFSILEIFLRHPNRLYSRAALIDQVWKCDRDFPDEMTVKSHIKSLRKSLKTIDMGDLIETVYGMGYRINSRYCKDSIVI